MAEIDVLIPTFSRPAALAVTLATLIGQRFVDFRVVVSDQTEDCDVADVPEVTARYRVAWVGGCVLYDVARLREVGGFDFWTELPRDHCGEDVVAQMKVMARYGGCGLIPSGVFHQELPTTVRDRRVNAPLVLADELTAPVPHRVRNR